MSVHEEKHHQNEKDKQNKNILENFGVNLTKKAENGELDPIIGREKDINRATQILSRKKKNNPMIVGNPGSGKTALVEGIAQRIITNDVPHTIQDKEVWSINMASIVAGTKYRGEFEERMVALVNHLKENKHIIVFFDEIHTVLGAGGASGSLDAANILKPALSNGDIHCIGATTYNEFRENIEKDGALMRRFQKINFEDPSIEETKKILKNLKGTYETFHKVSYSDEIIEELPGLAIKYIADRHLPDSAIDILDEVGAKSQIESVTKTEKLKKLEAKMLDMEKKKMDLVRQEKWKDIKNFVPKYHKVEEEILDEKEKFQEQIKNRNITNITKDDLLSVISLLSNIPLDELDKDGKDKIREILENLNTNLIGQEEATNLVVKSLKKSVMGMSAPNKPISSFLFLGKTGVGKTELAKILSSGWFNKDMIRIDMSEYMESHTTSKLIGTPPGYVGYESAGQLTEKVRNNPYSLILLDEIEKAHPKVLNVLLQMLDEGFLTDGQGKTVNFKNCIIIMTSNLGARKSQIKSVGFGLSDVGERTKLETTSINEAKNHFSPEIWNRIDQVVVFNALEKEHITRILELEINKVKMLLETKNIKLKVGPKVKEKIIEEGFSEDYGARHLARTVESMLKDEITEFMFEEDGADENCTLNVKWDNKNEKVSISKKKLKAKTFTEYKEDEEEKSSK